MQREHKVISKLTLCAHDEADLRPSDAVAELQQAMRAPVPDHRIAAGELVGRELHVSLGAAESVERKRENLRTAPSRQQ